MESLYGYPRGKQTSSIYVKLKSDSRVVIYPEQLVTFERWGDEEDLEMISNLIFYVILYN